MYKIIFSKKALDFFKKLDKPIQERIGKKIQELSENPRLGVPLIGNLTGLYKLRVGDYRTIYKIVEGNLVILILKIGHRKNVYD